MCQVAAEEWRLERNLDRTLRALDRAAVMGAEIAVTPECVLTGYPWVDSAPLRSKLREHALELDSLRISAVRESAARHRMAVLLGVAEREGESVYNSAVFIDRNGEITSVYRKVHCRSFEDKWWGNHFTPGDEFRVIEFDRGGETVQLGLMICFDREMPESTRCLRAMGAEVILCPLACPTSRMGEAYRDYADNEELTRFRAAESESYIVVVNHAEPRFNGGSFAVGPGGELVRQLGEKPEVTVISLPLEPLRTMRRNPLGQFGWGYRRPEVYKRHL